MSLLDDFGNSGLSFSKLLRLIAAVALVSTGISRAEDPVLPPELAALDAQFLAMEAERVKGPFEAEVAKLNASYLQRLKKLIEEETAAGRLDGVLALDAEQEHVAFQQTIPESDD